MCSVTHDKRILLLIVQQNREENKTETNFFGLMCGLTYETELMYL